MSVQRRYCCMSGTRLCFKQQTQVHQVFLKGLSRECIGISTVAMTHFNHSDWLRWVFSSTGYLGREEREGCRSQSLPLWVPVHWRDCRQQWPRIHLAECLGWSELRIIRASMNFSAIFKHNHKLSKGKALAPFIGTHTPLERGESVLNEPCLNIYCWAIKPKHPGSSETLRHWNNSNPEEN